MAGKNKKEARVESKKEKLDFVFALLFIPGCSLIGIALGMLVNRLLIVSLLGLGIGFVLAAVFRSLKK
jgi:hypothetical protein